MIIIFSILNRSTFKLQMFSYYMVADISLSFKRWLANLLLFLQITTVIYIGAGFLLKWFRLIGLYMVVVRVVLCVLSRKA